jgi:hypothetical protein
MQFRPLLTLVASFALAPMAYATSPHAPSAQELGAAQGVVDFCNKIDAGDKSDFVALGQREFAGLSPQKIAEIRNSAAYKQAYALLQTVLGKFSDANARAACKAIAPEAKKKPEERGTGGRH